MSKFTHPFGVIFRAQEIAAVCAAYGVGGALASLGFEIGRHGLAYAGASVDPKRLDATLGRSLAQTLTALGPTFIKLGQILATRPDWVGEPVAEELRGLFDKVPGVPYAQIERVLKKQLGAKKFARTFATIDSMPIASASLGQVHRAVLKDGREVFLKVRKPGTSRKVVQDLSLLSGVVASIHRVHPGLQLAAAFEDFKRATLAEIDYRLEAKNIDRFKKNYRKLFSSAHALFPSYIPEILTESVIALEPMRGEKLAELRRGSTVARAAAAQSLEAVLEQIFDHGFFHADPHAGNLFFQQESGQVGFIDMGLVGQLEPQDKQRFLRVLLAILKRDKSKLARALYEMGTPGKTTEYTAFKKAVTEWIDRNAATARSGSLEKPLQELLKIARQHGLYIPNRYLLLLRSCLMIEGVARGLDPNISLVRIALPVVSRSLLKTYNPLARLLRRK